MLRQAVNRLGQVESHHQADCSHPHHQGGNNKVKVEVDADRFVELFRRFLTLLLESELFLSFDAALAFDFEISYFFLQQNPQLGSD